MPIRGLDHVAITCADVEATLDFYKRVLGATTHWEDLWRAGQITVVILQVGASRLSVHDAASPASPHAQRPTPGSADVCFRYDGPLDEARQMLVREGGDTTGFVKGGAALVFAAFGVKAGLFPLFFWLPASYHTPAPIVTALFAGLLTKVGVYSFLRVASLLIGDDFDSWQTLFLWVAALTMITGVLGAAAQFEMRKILSFHIISQVGYLLAGLAMFTPPGLAAGLFYFVHNNLAKTNLLLVSAWIEHRRGTVDLARIGGFYRSSIGCSLIFLVSALALAGIPPLSGFWAKLGVVRAGVDGGFYWLTAAALAVGMMTLFSMTKIWGEAFWKKDPSDTDPAAGEEPPAGPFPPSWISLSPMTLVVVAILGLSLFGEPVFAWSMEAAQQLLDPSGYIEAVLQKGGAR